MSFSWKGAQRWWCSTRAQPTQQLPPPGSRHHQQFCSLAYRRPIRLSPLNHYGFHRSSTDLIVLLLATSCSIGYNNGPLKVSTGLVHAAQLPGFAACWTSLERGICIICAGWVIHIYHMTRLKSVIAVSLRKRSWTSHDPFHLVLLHLNLSL